MRKLQLAIIELNGGGYVIADGDGENPLRAVTSLGECAAAVRELVEEQFQPVEQDETAGETLEFPKVLGAVNENSPKRGLLHRLFKGG